MGDESLKINPLDFPGTMFDLELFNPNPTSSKTKDGPIYRLSFEVPQELWQFFMDANTSGMMLAAKAMVVEGNSMPHHQFIESNTAQKPYGILANTLYKSAFFFTPKVWAALGTHEEYVESLKGQPCMAKGCSTHISCGGDVSGHPFRLEGDRTEEGVDPHYSAIPLCHQHRSLAHAKGEVAIGSLEWWKKARNSSVHQWAWHKATHALGYDSMGKVSPPVFLEWASSLGLEGMVPPVYKEGQIQ